MKKKLLTRILTLCLTTVLFLGDCGIANAAPAFTGGAVSASETAESETVEIEGVSSTGDTVDTATTAQATETSEPTMGEYGVIYKNYVRPYHEVLRTKLVHYQGYTGKGVTVAVVGRGERAELAANMINKPGLIEESVTNVPNIGVAPGANVITVSVETDGKIYADGEDIADGINQALADDADIICLTVGSQYYSKAAEDAVKRAYEKGVPVFCPAGDSASNTILYPGYTKGVAPVAALNEDMTKASYSAYGNKVKYSVNYYFNSGTPTTVAACAITAGGAAVLWNQVKGTGKKRVDNLYALMDRNCTKANGNGLGKGVINLAKALKVKDYEQAPEKPVILTPAGEVKDLDVTVSFQKPAEDVVIYYTTDGSTPVASNYATSNYNHCLDSDDFDENGIATKRHFCGNNKNNICTIRAIAYNEKNGLKSPEVKVKYTIKPPVSYVSTFYKGEACPGATLRFDVFYKGYDAVYKSAYKPKWSLIEMPEGAKKGMATMSTGGVLKFRKDAVLGEYVVQVDFNGEKRYNSVYLSELAANPVVKLSAKKKNYTIDCTTSDYVDIPLEIVHKDGSKGSSYDDIRWYVAYGGAAISVSETENGIRVKADITDYKLQNEYIVTVMAEESNVPDIDIKIKVIAPVSQINIYPAIYHNPNCNIQDKFVPGSTLKLNTNIYTWADGQVKSNSRKLKWSVSPVNDSITVTNGTVKIGKDAVPGTYTVTAKANDIGGVISNEFSFEVIPKEQQVTYLTLDDNTMTINANETRTAYSIGVNCDTDNWFAQSSNPRILEVWRIDKSDGTVFLLLNSVPSKTTSVTITVYATDGSGKKATLKVTIMKMYSDVCIGAEKGRSLYLAEGCSVNLTNYFTEQYGKADTRSKKMKYEVSEDAPVVIKGNRITAKAYDVQNDSAEVIATPAVKDYRKGLYDTSRGWFTVYIVKKLNAIYLSSPTYQGEELKVGEKKVLRLFDENGNIISNKKERIKVEVSKEGMTAELGSEDYNNTLSLYPSKPGTYKVTLSSTDGSNVKKTYTFKVVE